MWGEFILKQVIVMRKDLNMRKGKMCAQAAHASMKVLLDRSKHKNYRDGVTVNELIIPIKDIKKWILGSFTKVVVSVDSEKELFTLYSKAKEANIPCALIQDTGKTEFNEPTYTCCAIGPCDNNKVDTITGDLKLL